jgi:anti-sigma factor RsiW
MSHEPNEPLPGVPARRPTRQHLDTDALSDFLDGRLDPEGRATAAAHLAVCPDCRRELEELRTAVALLSGLPQYRPRRSFQLGPAYTRPLHASRLARFLPLLPALRTVTAVVALLFAVAAAGGILIDSDGGPPSATEPAALDAAPPVSAQEPTGRDAQTGAEEREGAAQAGADSGAAESGASAGEAIPADEGIAAPAEDGSDAPAPAPGAKPTAAPASQGGQATGGVAAESDDEFAGGGAATDQEQQPSTQSQPVVQNRGGGDDGLSRWQAAQIGLGLLLAVLVAMLIALQRLANRARRLDPGF